MLPRPTNAAPRASYTQDGKLPLHYAATKGALFDVVKLLLGANPKAVTEADKARSPQLSPRALRCRRNLL